MSKMKRNLPSASSGPPDIDRMEREGSYSDRLRPPSAKEERREVEATEKTESRRSPNELLKGSREGRREGGADMVRGSERWRKEEG